MKGTKVFNEAVLELFPADPARPFMEADEVGSGRDPKLIEARNEHLMYRYYYYIAFGDKRWEAVVKLLSREFYLSEVTVSKIIMENAELRRKIMNEKTGLKELREKFDWVKWP